MIVDRDIKPENVIGTSRSERVPWLGNRTNRRRPEERELEEFDYLHDEGRLSYQRGYR